MKRRTFIQGSSKGLLGLGLTTNAYTKKKQAGISQTAKSYVTLEEEKVFVYSELIKESVKLVHIADTHLFKDDERGLPFKKYSGRMAGAYNQTIHFKTNAATNPEQAFEEALQFAKEVDADLLTLVGDIFSFPSEAAIEWVEAKLKEIPIPFIYVAGNHDWHYEGMEGSLEKLRATWIEKRLLPLYQGRDPLMAAYDIKGVRFIAIDNSTYEINEKQLAFFRKHIASGMPIVLLIHIPLYAPGRSISFGCGNPNWGAANDRNFELERRPKWPEGGHSQTTFDFHKEVFNAPNLLSIFAGHIHRQSLELINGIPQIVSDDNASGAFLDISFHALNEKDRKLLK